MMPTRTLRTFFLLAATSVGAQDYYLDPGTTFVRGVVSVENAALADPTWRAFAGRTQMLLADTGHSPAGRLSALATATGHAEVAVAPIVPFGLSANGRRALQTAVAQPERCIAFIPQRPGRCFATGNEGFNFNRLDQTVASSTLFDYAPAFTVPALFLAGELDNLSGTVLPLGSFEFGRRTGAAPWALAVEPAVTHTGAAMPPALVTAWLESIIARRLPAANWPASQAPTLLPIDLTTGWLADPTTREVAAWTDFAGDRSRAAWLPDEATATAWSAATLALPYTLPEQPITLPAAIANLQVFDPANSTIHPADQAGGTSGGAAWKACANLKEGDLCYVNAHGSAIFSVPPSVRGADWIRPMENARTSTANPLLSFNVSQSASVFVAHDTAIVTKPAWLASWTDTGRDILLTTGSTPFDQPRVLRLFRKDFDANALVELGPNGGGNNDVMYLTAVKTASDTPDASVFLVPSDPTASEAGLDPASVTVSRGSATSGDLTILYTVGGTANAGSDYQTLPGSVIIPDGQSSATITLTPLQDSDTEGTETILLTLTPDIAYTLGTPASASIDLLDDDGVMLPVVTISSDRATVAEGPAATVHLTLTRTGSTTAALPVTLSVTGDAAYGSDYSEFSLNTQIPAGASSVTLSVAIINDGLAESDETLVVTVLPTTNYSAGTPDSITITLTDPPLPPVIDPSGFRFPDGSVIDIVALYPNVIPDDGLDDTAGLQQALSDYADQNRILWLRNGTYHVSDTLQFTGNERFNTLQGQSRDDTILLLLPNSPGFGPGDPEKPMFFIDPGGSADRFQNEIYSLTFDTGLGNPAATGLHFISNNQGGLRDLRIRSADPASTGIGLNLSNGLNGPLLVRDVVIEGFRLGIQTGNALNSATLEDIILLNQLEAGLRNVQQVVTIRRLISRQANPVPAIINGDDNTAAQHWFGLLTLVDSTLECTADPAPDHAIVSVGNTCAADVAISGYTHAARLLYGNFTGIPAADLPLSGPGIPLWLKAYNTTNPATFQPLTFENPFAGMPRFEVLDTPELPWDDPATWVNVAAFATGDGTTDDTAAFQSAIDSMKPGGFNHGKTTLYVPAGPQFRITGTVNISGPVRRIIGLKGRIRGEAAGRFRLTDSGPDDAPIVRIERLNGFSNNFFIEHASTRTLAVVNTTGARLVGSGRGDFFIEDVVGAYHSFTHPWQRIWARQFNTEATQTKIDNVGAVLWILGLKTEKNRTVIDTRDGGFTQLVGAFIYRIDEAASHPDPMFRVTDASAYFFGVGEYDATGTRHYPTLLTETRGTETRTLERADFTRGGRHNGSRVIYLTNAAAGNVPAPFEIWSRSRPGTSIPPDPNANQDGDLLNDLFEYLLDGDPGKNDASKLPSLQRQPDGAFHFEFELPSQGRSDVRLTVQEASLTLDTAAWQNTSIPPTLEPDTATGRTRVTHRIPPETPAPHFLRLSAEWVPD